MQQEMLAAEPHAEEVAPLVEQTPPPARRNPAATSNPSTSLVSAARRDADDTAQQPVQEKDQRALDVELPPSKRPKPTPEIPTLISTLDFNSLPAAIPTGEYELNWELEIPPGFNVEAALRDSFHRVQERLHAVKHAASQPNTTIEVVRRQDGWASFNLRLRCYCHQCRDMTVKEAKFIRCKAETQLDADNATVDNNKVTRWRMTFRVNHTDGNSTDNPQVAFPFRIAILPEQNNPQDLLRVVKTFVAKVGAKGRLNSSHHGKYWIAHCQCCKPCDVRYNIVVKNDDTGIYLLVKRTGKHYQKKYTKKPLSDKEKKEDDDEPDGGEDKKHTDSKEATKLPAAPVAKPSSLPKKSGNKTMGRRARAIDAPSKQNPSQSRNAGTTGDHQSAENNDDLKLDNDASDMASGSSCDKVAEANTSDEEQQDSDDAPSSAIQKGVR